MTVKLLSSNIHALAAESATTTHRRPHRDAVVVTGNRALEGAPTSAIEVYSSLVDSTRARACPRWKRMPMRSPASSVAASCTTTPFSRWMML